jgi:hypothetical protein
MNGWEKTGQSFINAIKARIPKTAMTPEFNAESLPAKRDTWGEVIETPERTFPYSPIRKSKTTTDPVRIEAYNLRIKGGVPGKSIMDVKLDPKQFWEGYAGPAGVTAHSLLMDVINDPSWRSMEPYIKREIFKEVLDAAHEAARDQALADNPQIADKVIRKTERNINAKPDQPRAR